MKPKLPTRSVLQDPDEEQVDGSADGTDSHVYIARKAVGQICCACYDSSRHHKYNGELHHTASLE